MISVRKGTVEDLYYFEGYRIKKTWLGTSVINGSAKFYTIYDDTDMVSDFWIYENNSIGGLEKEIIGNDEMMKKQLDCIKNEYQYVIVPIFSGNVKSLEFLKKYEFFIEKEEKPNDKNYYILRKNF